MYTVYLVVINYTSPFRVIMLKLRTYFVNICHFLDKSLQAHHGNGIIDLINQHEKLNMTRNKLEANISLENLIK